jgi:plasmid stabilization system protein ParE
MPKYILTNKAVLDLKGIWNYTFDTWSETHNLLSSNIAGNYRNS